MENTTFEQIPANQNSKGLGMTYGLLTGLAMVVYSLVLHFTNVGMGSWLNFIVLAIFLVGVVMFCIAYGKSMNNQVTFGMVFKASFRMVALTTIILVAWALIAVFLFPEMKEKALEYSQQKMVEKKLSAKQIEESMNFTRDKYTLLTTMMVMFSNLFYGVVFSLIGAAVTRKDKKGVTV